MLSKNAVVNNLLTVDLEEWFHANYKKDIINIYKYSEHRIVENTHRLLKLFEECNAKATFFVLGWVAENYPKLVLDVCNKGHEIATHGYGHDLVGELSREKFIDDLVKSKQLIESIIGKKIIGYRAPSWSINKSNFWVFDILKEYDFQYDASIFPVNTFLYGIPDAPRFPYVLKQGILEIPCSTINLIGKNFGFSGGFYLRILPLWLVKYGINTLNKQGIPAVIYIHPREIDLFQPKILLSRKESFIHYYGIKNCYEKLRNLLKKYRFTSIRDYFNFT
ncbi:XrtA system polysaccharide deacetylase [Desulfotruncus alcoholivorax]|uniref:XrtA system polysaccharide deacetylase n=1 Tax=Desulfotruncus alcoholivorax TaxID=265477 RepID=UPI0003FFB52C|nr:XrtA system polysaccharide deacetylase [Desulfotruncus alcoholivorax]